MKLPLLLTASLLAALLVGGCAAKEELLAKSAVVPAGMNLSGQWQLRLDDQETVKRIDDAELAAAGGLESIIGKTQRRSDQRTKRSMPGSLVHVFLEAGKALKITQTADGVFISFDRSIVEEYRFGEKREINVGPVTADRVSGWEQGAYVIETLDKDGAKLIETYRLEDNKSKLVRSISIWNGGQRQLSIEQVFDRV